MGGILFSLCLLPSNLSKTSPLHLLEDFCKLAAAAGGMCYFSGIKKSKVPQRRMWNSVKDREGNILTDADGFQLVAHEMEKKNARPSIKHV